MKNPRTLLWRVRHAGAAGAAALLALVALPIGATGSQAQQTAASVPVDPGLWELRSRSNGALRRICVRSGRELVQLRHRQPGCEQFVVDSSARAATVQYSCRGNGYGRTTIRLEGSRLAQIETRGVEGGRPFAASYEARRVANC